MTGKPEPAGAGSSGEGNDPPGQSGSLRVLDVLRALAQAGEPRSPRQLTESLNLPRASLPRPPRPLGTAGGLCHGKRGYAIGPESQRLARLIGAGARPLPFTQVARPVLERLAAETDETVILGLLSERRQEIVYADVIVADSPLQYAVPAGDHRPLYSSATGKSVLAFMPEDEQQRYIAETPFEPITPFTTRHDQIGPLLEGVRRNGVIHDKDGHFVGAGAIASPIFNASGNVFAAIVVAGPSDRLDRIARQVADLVREAGKSISRLMEYDGPYPPPWPKPGRA